MHKFVRSLISRLAANAEAAELRNKTLGARPKAEELPGYLQFSQLPIRSWFILSPRPFCVFLRAVFQAVGSGKSEHESQEAVHESSEEEVSMYVIGRLPFLNGFFIADFPNFYPRAQEESSIF